MRGLMLDALLPVGVMALLAAGCLAALGGVPGSGWLALGLGAVAVILLVRAHLILSDAGGRLELLRRAFGLLGEDVDLGPLPEGADELGQMGRALRAGHTRLQAARVEVAHLAAEAEAEARRSTALATFASAAGAAAEPRLVWAALNQALHGGCGSDLWYRVLLRHDDSGDLREVAEGGQAIQRPGAHGEVPLSTGGHLVGVLQWRTSVPQGPPGAFLDALAGHAALAWSTAEHTRRLQENTDADPLTGLCNREWLDRYATKEVARARRSRQAFSIVLADLDRFKVVNDTYGHAAGDTALRAVAACIGHLAREADVVARHGGDEILLVLPDTALDGALAMAERLRLAVAGVKVAHAGRPIPLTVSVGCAAWPVDETSWEAMVAAADLAMYQAKRAGRNRVEAARPPFPSATVAAGAGR